MIFGIKGRILVGVGIFTGALIAFYLAIYLPGIRYRETLNFKILQQNARLIKLKEKFVELKRLKEENQKIRQKLVSLEGKLKGTETSFLYELGIRGRTYRIEYLDITPLPRVEEKYYFRTPVKIHLYGKYHNLGMLISDMIKRGGAGSFTIDNILLKPSSKKGYTVEGNLTLSLYRYKAPSFPDSVVIGKIDSLPGDNLKETARRKR